MSVKYSVAISVIMSVYHTREEYLRTAIESILNQTFRDFEFIIFDDGNDEGTRAILREYKEKDGRIILYENEKNIGLTKNLNRGIRCARGKYIARMDADDVSFNYRFTEQYHYMERHPKVAVVGGRIYSGNLLDKNYEYMSHKWRQVNMLFRNTGVYHPSAFIRAGFLSENELLYNENYSTTQDYELWARCMRLGKFKTLNKVVLEYRNHADQITVSRRSVQRDNEIKIKNWMFKELDDTLSEKELQQLCELDNIFLSAKEMESLFSKLIVGNNYKRIYDENILECELILRWYWIVRGVINCKDANSFKMGIWYKKMKTPRFLRYLIESRIRRELCEPRAR